MEIPNKYDDDLLLCCMILLFCCVAIDLAMVILVISQFLIQPPFTKIFTKGEKSFYQSS